MKKRIILVSVIAIIFIAFLIPTVRDFLFWQYASIKNTTESYKFYAEKWTNGIYISEADFRYDNLIWQKAKEINKINSYNDYKNDRKAKKYTNEANNLINALKWENTKQINTVGAYKQFLDSNLTSKYADDAIMSLLKLENISSKENAAYKNAEDIDMEFKYVQFLKNFKNSPLAYKAKMKLLGYKKIKFEKETIVTIGDLKRKYNWNGEKLLWQWSNDLSGIEMYSGSVAFMSSEMINPSYAIPFEFGIGFTFGKVCIGNLQIDGNCELIENGIKFYNSSILIYKIKS